MLISLAYNVHVMHPPISDNLLGNALFNVLDLIVQSSDSLTQLNDASVCCRDLLLCLVPNGILVGIFDNLYWVKRTYKNETQILAE